MTTTTQPAPHIVSVEYTPAKTYNTIKMTTSASAIVTWSNGSKTILRDEAAVRMHRQWEATK